MESLKRFFKCFNPSFWSEEILKIDSQKAFFQAFWLLLFLSLIYGFHIYKLFDLDKVQSALKFKDPYPSFTITGGKLETSFERPKVYKIGEDRIIFNIEDSFELPEEVPEDADYILLNDSEIKFYKSSGTSRAVSLESINQSFGDPFVFNKEKATKWSFLFIKILKVFCLLLIPLWFLFALPFCYLAASLLTLFIKLLLNWKLSFGQIFSFSVFAATPFFILRSLLFLTWPQSMNSGLVTLTEWAFFLSLLFYVCSQFSNSVSGKLKGYSES